MYIQETVNNSIVEESGYVQCYAENPYYTHSYITYSCVGVKCSLYNLKLSNLRNLHRVLLLNNLRFIIS